MGQVHIRLHDDAKEEWEQYAEEHGYGSLSRLVRVAVENERQDGQADPQTHTGEVSVSLPDSVATSNEINQLSDTLLRLITRFEDIETAVKRAEKGIIKPSDPRAVLEALPPERPQFGDEGYIKEEPPTFERPKAGSAIDGRAESVAKITEESIVSVKYHLAIAAHHSDDIQADVMGGEIRYWLDTDE